MNIGAKLGGAAGALAPPLFCPPRGFLLYIQRRHCNLGHRAMGRVVFLPRPESRGTFLAIITHNIGSSLLNNFTK